MDGLVLIVILSMLLIISISFNVKQWTRNDNLQMELKTTKNTLNPLLKYKNGQADDLEKIFSERKSAYPYVAALMSDYLLLDLYRLERIAATGTYYQRTQQVIRINEIRLETKELLKKYKEYEYQLKYLLDSFPVLQEYLEFDDVVERISFDTTESDPLLNYLSEKEYQSLSETERNQLALDRYVEKHTKSKWQIGRDYELSVGYQYEQKGYKVCYFGSLNGVEDLGRDLIAIKDDVVLVIQCKYWSAEKTIHEKHICQLFATAMCYQLDHPEYKVKPLFITSTNLSETAKGFADKLHVTCKENYPLKDFPRIKCNIGRSDIGLETYIYHLPMDPSYDSVIIDKKGEFKAFTVCEAEKKGFRRAYKWHGNK